MARAFNARIVTLLGERPVATRKDPETHPTATTVNISGDHHFVNVGCEVHIDRLNNQAPRARMWKSELIGLIVDVAAELELSAADLVQLAKAKLQRRNISDLEQLSADDLGLLYQIVSELKRPALK